MKTFFTAACLCCVMAGYAQVGVGTSSPETSAQLDISSNNKGILIPRMNATERGAIPSPATGLMVYQTEAPAGFYYNAGTPAAPNWLRVQAGSSSASATDLIATNTAASGAIPTGVSQDVAFNSATVAPSAGSYNTSTYSYTVGVSGSYMINVAIYVSGTAPVPSLRLHVDGTITDWGVYSGNTNLGTSDTYSGRGTITVVKKLTAGQVLKISTINGNTINPMTIATGATFSITKL